MRFFLRIILAYFLLLPFFSFGQKTEIANYKAELKKCQTDSCRAEYLSRLGRSYLYLNTDSTHYYSDKLLNVFGENTSPNIKFIAINLKASAYLQARNLSKADSVYNILKKLSRDNNNLHSKTLYANLGLFYYLQSKYDSSTLYFTKTLEILDTNEISDIMYAAGILKQLAEIDSKTLNYQKAINRLILAEKYISKYKSNDVEFVRTYIAILISKGSLYNKSRDTNSAIAEYKKAIKASTNQINAKLTAYGNLANIYYYLGETDSLKTMIDTLEKNYEYLSNSSKCHYFDLKTDYFTNTGNYKEAKKQNELLLSCLESNDYKEYLQDHYLNKGIIEIQQRKFKDAFLSLEKAKRTFENNEVNNKNIYADILFNLLRAGINSKQPKLEPLLTEYKTTIDSISADIVEEEVIKTREIYETEKKEAEIQKLKQEQKIKNIELKNQRLMIFMSLIGLALVGLLSYIFYIKAKQRKQLNEELKEKYEELKYYNKELIDKIKQLSNDDILQQYLTLADRQKTKIKLENILFLKSKNKAAFIHTTDGQIYKDWHQSLKGYSSVLPEDIFTQINRATIVNKTHIISKQNGNIKLRGNVELPFSPRYNKNL